MLDNTIVVVGHPGATDGAVVGDHENVIRGILISHRPARRWKRRLLWPSRLPISIVRLIFDGRIAATVAQLDTESVVENARQCCGIDMLVMTQVLNGPVQALVVLPVDAFDQFLGERPGIAAVLIRFEMGMPQERFVDVGVVVDRNQVRRLPQPAAYQCPGRQCVMVVINDVDIFPVDVLMLA